MFRSINPYNQAVIAEFAEHDDSALRKKLDGSAAAFKKWKKENFETRAVPMQQLAVFLRQNKEEFARIITLEMGKAIGESRAEIEKCATASEYFANHGAALLADSSIATDAKRSYISYEPTGAVLGIMPWNFPFWQVFRFVLPNVMGGNVALLKHAPNVSLASITLEKIFLEAGFPEGVFQSLLIDVDKVESVIGHEVVQGVTLTGSEYAGSRVASLAGKHIKKSVLELGGSDPLIVLEDADLEKAAKVAVQSRMQNAGQSCIASKRLLVMEKVKDEFTSHVANQLATLKQGNPLDENFTTGPIARIDLAEKLEVQMNASVERGAQLMAGGTRDGCNFAPALLLEVTPNMSAFDEETFGPLASITSVQHEGEAIELANRSRFGLGASIWTRDLDRAAAHAKEIESGAVFVNGLVRSDPRWPFGGIKKSGYGRELAELGSKEFLNAKTIVME